MYMTQDNQRILNWLNKEKEKDKIDVQLAKKKYIKEIKNLKKEDLFPIPKKLTLWKRIKMILGL